MTSIYEPKSPHQTFEEITRKKYEQYRANLSEYMDLIRRLQLMFPDVDVFDKLEEHVSGCLNLVLPDKFTPVIEFPVSEEGRWCWCHCMNLMSPSNCSNNHDMCKSAGPHVSPCHCVRVVTYNLRRLVDPKPIERYCSVHAKWSNTEPLCGDCCSPDTSRSDQSDPEKIRKQAIECLVKYLGPFEL